MSQSGAPQSVSGRQLRKQSTDRSPWIVAGVILGVVLVVVAGYFATRLTAPQVLHFPDEGSGSANHLANIDDPLPTPWNSNPPTSGWHWGGGAANPGIKDSMLPDTVTVHNLEHGFVIFHYRADLDAATVQRLQSLTQELQQRNPCIILEPRPTDQIDVPIVATAWTYMLKLETFDDDALRQFYRQYVGKGPEQICPVGA